MLIIESVLPYAFKPICDGLFSFYFFVGQDQIRSSSLQPACGFSDDSGVVIVNGRPEMHPLHFGFGSETDIVTG